MFAERLPYLLVYLAALTVSTVVFFYAWRNRSGKGIQFFAWSILLEISWLIGYLCEVYVTSLEAKIFWDNVQYIGAFLAPVLLIAFAVEFTDTRVNARQLILYLSSIPLLLILAIFLFTSQAPELVRSNALIEPGRPFDELTYGFGMLTLVGNIYLLLMMVVYLAVLVSGFFRPTHVTRQQLSLVLSGTLIPLFGFVGLAFGWEFANQRDISPLLFALSNGVIAFGIFRFRLFNVIPVARQALFETIEDVLIVLDENDRVVDANPSARKAFGWETRNLEDVSIADTLPDLYAQFEHVRDAHTEVSLPDGTDYELKITTIADRSGNPVGRLISAHDITSQKQVARDLQRTGEQNKQRAAQFQTIAHVASSITSVQELQKTLTQITMTLSQELGYYHIGIFLLDSSNQYAILQAANSDGGQRMLAERYRLKVGETGIVSAAVTSGRPQISLSVDRSRIFHLNPFLPDTRSEMALPIRTSGQLIGVLDIQSLHENAFSTDDMDVFDIVASQVGIAIQNARLYEQNVQSLKETEEAYRRLSGTSWSNLAQLLDVRAYAYDGVSSHPVSELRGSQNAAALSVPITVRGQVIGNLRLNPLDPNRTWTEDDLAITNAVAERAALALEAARLLDEAQRRASRETFLSDMAAKLSTSFQLDSILRDTVEELGHTLKNSTVSFQLINPSAPPTNGEPSDGMNGQRKRAD